MGDLVSDPDLEPADQAAMRRRGKHRSHPKARLSLPVNRRKVKSENLNAEEALALKSHIMNRGSRAKLGRRCVGDFRLQTWAEMPAKLDRLGG